MFKRREKKDKQQANLELVEEDKEEESVSEVVHEFKERAKKRVAMGPALENFEGDEQRLAREEYAPAFYDSQHHKDLGEYLGKRDSSDQPKDSLNEQLEKLVKERGGLGGKLSEILTQQKNARNLEEDFKKLAKVEKLSKQIKESAKDRAYWSIGMIEVDVGIDRKVANIEATEAEKRKRLIQEYVKAKATHLFKTGAVKPVDQNAANDPITNWIWKPKDLGLSAKEKEKRELTNMLKAFNKSGKVYKNKKLLGQLGLNPEHIGHLNEEDFEDD